MQPSKRMRQMRRVPISLIPSHQAQSSTVPLSHGALDGAAVVTRCSAWSPPAEVGMVPVQEPRVDQPYFKNSRSPHGIRTISFDPAWAIFFRSTAFSSAPWAHHRMCRGVQTLYIYSSRHDSGVSWSV